MNTDIVVSFRGKRKAGLFGDGLNLFMRIESGVKNKKTSHTRYLTRFLAGFLSGTYNLLFYMVPYRIRIDDLFPLLLLVFYLFEKRRSPQLGPQAHFAENLSDFESEEL